VSVLLGNGDGTFGLPTALKVGICAESVVAGDFNGDGKLDLAVANTCDDTVSMLLGKGDGTFMPQATFAVGVPPPGSPPPPNINFGPTFLAASDFDGDGNLDLAVANLFSDMSLLLGKGDGTFQAARFLTTRYGSQQIAVGDFDGNGTSDLAVLSRAGMVGVMPGNGNGTFQLPQLFAAGSSLTAGTFNGGRRLDIVVARSGSNDVSVLLNTTR
jgi:hypothetical protein